MSYRHIEKEPEVAQTFDYFIKLHEKRWTLRGATGGSFRRERFRTFHQHMVRVFEQRGWLSLSLLTVIDLPVAGIYGFTYEGTYSYYLPGFDPDPVPRASPGTLLLAHRIEQTIEEGCECADLLQGNAAYKRNWAHDTRRSLTIRAYNRRWPALLRKLSESAKHSIKLLMR